MIPPKPKEYITWANFVAFLSKNRYTVTYVGSEIKVVDSVFTSRDKKLWCVTVNHRISYNNGMSYVYMNSMTIPNFRKVSALNTYIGEIFEIEGILCVT